MWILPKNHPLFSHFVVDTVDLNKELKEWSEYAEHSLTWRSKFMPSQIWLRKWKQVHYFQLLFGRTLKPSMVASFKAKLTLCVVDIPVNHLVSQGQDGGWMIQDIYGPTYKDLSEKSNQTVSFLKMLKDTYRWDSQQSSVIWKKLVMTLRSEYLQRQKLGRITSEKESLYWGTPNTSGIDGGSNSRRAAKARGMWPTPQAADSYRGPTSPERNEKRLGGVSLQSAAKWWPTPRAMSGVSRKPGTGGKCLQEEARKEDQITTGQLNPVWVEWLMGLPSGWTDLDYWEMG